MNHPVKRISLVGLLGERACDLALNGESAGLNEFKEPEVLTEEALPFSSSDKGVYVCYIEGLSVSSDGDRVWACHIQQKVKTKYQSRLISLDFANKSEYLFDHQHQGLIQSVLVSEARNIALTGVQDQTLFLHDLGTRQTIRKFDMKHGSTRCLLDLGTAVALGDEDTLRFLDLEKNEIVCHKAKLDVKCIRSMGVCVNQNGPEAQLVLLAGGRNSNKMTRITIPPSIARAPDYMLQTRERLSSSDKFLGKILLLENQNQQLRKENESLKKQLILSQNKDLILSEPQKKISELQSKLKQLELDLSEKIQKNLGRHN